MSPLPWLVQLERCHNICALTGAELDPEPAVRYC